MLSLFLRVRGAPLNKPAGNLAGPALKWTLGGGGLSWSWPGPRGEWALRAPHTKASPESPAEPDTEGRSWEEAAQTRPHPPCRPGLDSFLVGKA